MDLKNPKSLWVESLFDVSEPYLYVVVLPPLVLFALGLRWSHFVGQFGSEVKPALPR